jgi:hypothetical protein
MYAKRDSERHLQAIQDALALVPQDAPVSTTNRLGGQVSDRRYVFSFPTRDRADWVVVDRRDPWLAIAGEGDAPSLFRSELAKLAADRRFRMVFARNDVAAYRRVA